MTGASARVERSVLGDITDSLVITGDRNHVTVSLDGSEASEVRVRRPRRRGRVERLLFAAEAPPVGDERPLTWLRSDAGVIPLRPRPEDAALREWCEHGSTRVRLVCGRGGQGKTTSTRRLADVLRGAGWLAGFADLSAVSTGEVSAEAVRRRWAELAAALGSGPVRRGRVLLVVDYAESEPLVLRRLLGLVRDAPTVRLLLLSRGEGNWWPALSTDPAWSRLVDPEPLRLGSLTDVLSADEIARVWSEAVGRFATRLRLEVGPVTAPAREFATTLDLYADALLRVLDAHAGSRGWTTPDGGGDPIRGLMTHELRHVRGVLADHGVDVGEREQAVMLLAPFLVPAATTDEAVRALRALSPRVDPDGATRAARALGGLYPDHPDNDRPAGVWSPPRPDRLPDTHVLVLATEAASDEDWDRLVQALCGSDLPEHTMRVTQVLARCLSTPGATARYPHGVRRVRRAVRRLVRAHPKGYVLPVVLLLPGEFTPVLAEVLARTGEDALTTEDVRSIDRVVVTAGFSTHRAADVVLLSRRLTHDTTPSPDADRATWARHAAELSHLVVRLAEVGRREDALGAAQRAAAIHGKLAATDPADHLPDLAMALNNLSLSLWAVDRGEEALEPARHAVDLYAELAATNPTAHLPGLAAALNNFSLSLSKTGRWEESLEPARHAVDLYAELAATNPTPYLPGPAAALNNLAASLNNLAAALSEVGRQGEALEAAQRAVGIRERLAEADPTAYPPDLAAALNNLAGFLAESGRQEEALEPARRSSAIYGELAAADPIAYLPNLGTSLVTLADLLHDLGRSDEAGSVRRRLEDVRSRLGRPPAGDTS